ncbi:MAG: YifB family Mg chelatase-like AAA ATPase [Elusimicrobia bacterium]|nr:YifB family Mg chelatase-like AAA ATPase [Elusimicrobiota bacterium]
MLAKVWSAAVCGVDGYLVTVELDLGRGLPSYMTVGLPDSAVRESRERVVAAIRNSGYEFPCRRVTVNLAPAQFRKRGTQFDLPVALGILAASGQIPAGDWVQRYCFLGELALDGGIQPVSGILPMAASAASEGRQGVVLSRLNASEAALVGIQSLGAASLREVVGFIAGQVRLESSAPSRPVVSVSAGDLADVKGQGLGKRALEISAAGGHHLLLTGPPGVGKSMLAARLPGILPAPDDRELLEIAKMASVAGLSSCAAKAACPRPFRAPHHSLPPGALAGGGATCKPGEVSLAHGGVLFLDELPEFQRESLEALRAPLETRNAVVSRLGERVIYPADFLLVAAMNPCPCGWKGHPKRHCTCSPGQESRYAARLSGPLLDRIDLGVELSSLNFRQWSETVEEEKSAKVRARVETARARQAKRLAGEGLRLNAEMGPRQLRRHCPLAREAAAFMEAASERLHLSARSMDRVVKVSRTIADLECSEAISGGHLAEALALSGRDRRMER